MLRDKLISFLISQALIWLPLMAGYRLRKSGWVSGHLSRTLHSFNLIAVTPLIVILGIWRLDRSSGDWIMVPLLLGMMLAVSTGLAFVFGRRVKTHRAAAGTFSLLVPMSNTGHTLAGFLTLLLLGEAAYPYNAICMLPQLFFIFVVWVPLACHWGHDQEGSFGATFRRTLISPLSMPLLGLVFGLGLNFAGPAIPPSLAGLLKILVFVATTTTMFALGLRLHLRRLGDYHAILGWVFAAKFLIHPAVMVGLCLLFGVTGMPAGALFIVSCMPAGVLTVAFSNIYELDVDLANAGYLWSTAFFMFIVLPLMIWALQAPMFQ